jgi:hypothetical protein
MAENAPISTTRIAGTILHIRGEKVMLDADLAALYGVETKRLVEAVKRNRDRFPGDFMSSSPPRRATASGRNLRPQVPGAAGAIRRTPSRSTERSRRS